MTVAVYLPLLASMVLLPRLLARSTRRMPDALDPRHALVLLVGSALILAAASTAALALLVGAAVAQVPGVARIGEWSPEALAVRGPWTGPVGAAAALVLVVVLVRTGATAVRIGRHHRRALRDGPRGRDSDDGVVVLPDSRPYAVARPGLRRRSDLVVVSSGMVAGLDDCQRRVLVAHEKAHLAGRHHLYTAAVTIAEALNPMLAPLRRDVAYAAERCADEAAVAIVRDRTLVAHAVGRAALLVRHAQQRDESFVLGMTTGPVPRRVEALMSERGSDPWWPAGVGGLLVLGAAAAFAAAVHAGIDFHTLIEIAEIH